MLGALVLGPVDPIVVPVIRHADDDRLLRSQVGVLTFEIGDAPRRTRRRPRLPRRRLAPRTRSTVASTPRTAAPSTRPICERVNEPPNSENV
jgi:hypothetical protein